MSLEADARKLLYNLTSSEEKEDQAERDKTACELSDIIRSKELNENVLLELLTSLLAAALNEPNAIVRESMFSALSDADYSQAVRDVDWQGLAAALSKLDEGCLEHALIILGASGETKYIASVERYLYHKEAVIRQTANDAITELTRS